MSLRSSDIKSDFQRENCLSLARELAEAGRLREADLVVRQAREALEPAELVEARFHLLAGMLRADEWQQPLRLILANARTARQHQSPSALAFNWLGIALARFAGGRLVGACQAAQLALKEARTGQHDLAACLAGEILGQALMMTGQVVQGLAVLEQAIQDAGRLQRAGSVEHLRVQKQILFARYGGDPKTTAPSLLRLASKLSRANQRASLLLECARLEINLGRPAIARQHWREAVGLLPSPRHRRIDALVRARLGMLTAADGGSHEALVIVRAALDLIDPSRDLIAQAELLEVALAAHRAIGQLDEARAVALALSRVLARTGFRLPASAVASTPTSASGDLNHRQMELLSELTAGRYIDIRWYVDQYGVSTVTAFRDLSTLVHMGMLARVGRARATRYTLVHHA